MIKHITIVDSYFHHAEHEIFNTALLWMFADRPLKTTYYGSKSGIDNLKKILRLQQKENLLSVVTFKEIAIAPSSARDLTKNIVSALYNIWFLLSSKKNTSILFNYNNYLSIHLLNLFSSLLKKNVIICCHSEMQDLIQKRPGKIALRHRLLNNFFKKRSIRPKTHFIVLGDSIKLNLQKCLHEVNSKQIIAVDHPYFTAPTTVIDQADHSLSKPIKIGVIGVVKQEKGLKNLLSLATSLKYDIDNQQVRLFTISKVVGDIKRIKQHGITIINDGTALLTREEYSAHVSAMDFIFFPYELDSYQLAASGAVFESIFLEKPILALKNDFFYYLFQKYGAFGILCDSVEELGNKVREVIAGKIKKEDFTQNIQKMKSQLSPEYVGKSLITQLQKKNSVNSLS